MILDTTLKISEHRYINRCTKSCVAPVDVAIILDLILINKVHLTLKVLKVVPPFFKVMDETKYSDGTQKQDD